MRFLPLLGQSIVRGLEPPHVSKPAGCTWSMRSRIRWWGVALTFWWKRRRRTERSTPATPPASWAAVRRCLPVLRPRPIPPCASSKVKTVYRALDIPLRGCSAIALRLPAKTQPLEPACATGMKPIEHTATARRPTRAADLPIVTFRRERHSDAARTRPAAHRPPQSAPVAAWSPRSLRSHRAARACR